MTESQPCNDFASFPAPARAGGELIGRAYDLRNTVHDRALASSVADGVVATQLVTQYLRNQGHA